mmetsp:Transcript_16924/g.45887  ORF Transcript_16924/g.45887 Transcript_16924/m.45887 type:complete len:137 (-) Transcript_16924:122-532(-)
MFLRAAAFSVAVGAASWIYIAEQFLRHATSLADSHMELAQQVSKQDVQVRSLKKQLVELRAVRLETKRLVEGDLASVGEDTSEEDSLASRRRRHASSNRSPSAYSWRSDVLDTSGVGHVHATRTLLGDLNEPRGNL